MKRLRSLLAALVLAPLALSAASIPWTTDMDAARAESQVTGKPLMALFTGSDWCPWCIRLEDEVLSAEEFVEKVSDKFIFVFIDKPRKNPLPAEQAAANAALRSQYRVQSLPTIVLLAPDGERLGSTGYREGGATAFAEYLLDLTDDGNTSEQAN